MDDIEKRVLRRKRHIFAEAVEVSKDLLSTLQRKDVLTEHAARDLLNEAPSTTRALKLLELVTASSHGNAFQQLTSALMLEHAWLAKELECDVRCEKGDLHLDDDVEREAGMLVHRKFGTSRRLSEFDKKEIAGTIAIKIQMSKEEWKLELNKLRQELNEITRESEAKEKEIKLMDLNLTEFIRQNKQALVSTAHGLTSTSDTLRTSVADDDVISKMKERLEYLLQRMRRVISERDLMQNDREKCFKTLGLNDDSLTLHQIVQLKLVKMPSSVQTYQDEIAKKDQALKRVRRLLQDYENEAENKNQQIARLENDLVSKDKQMAVLEERIRQLERDKENRVMLVRAQTAYHSRVRVARNTRSARAGPASVAGRNCFPSIVAKS